MYGWLLESVQHFVIQEFGEDVWETILRDAGTKNAVFSATQQYPDALMPRLAISLSSLISKEAGSPSVSVPGSPAPKKLSLKSKHSWRSASVHNDGRQQAFKCPFTATNALTAATKKEIEAYNSSEEIRAQTLSSDRINEEPENNCTALVRYEKRQSLAIQLEEQTPLEVCQSPDSVLSIESEDRSTFSDASTHEVCKNISISRSPSKVGSTTNVYKKRGSLVAMRTRLNSFTVPGEKINALKDRFGTPDKVMHFFGRCFVKFFSNYGYDTMIRATGRYFCTFLQSVDSIHQRMRFTFPRMRSPSMQLTRAHRHGAELVYSSMRNGFTHYLMGQLYEIAEDIFSLKLKVSVVRESTEGAYYVAVLRLEFDNSDYV